MRKVTILSILLLSVFLLGFTAVNGLANYCGYPTVKIMVDGEEVIPDSVPAIVMNGQAMVPLQVVADALDAETEWDNETKTVKITKKIPEKLIPPDEDLISISNLQVSDMLSDRSSVEGTIKNGNDKRVDVNVTIYFYDSRGDTLGHIHVNEEKLDAGEKKKFHTVCENDVFRYDSSKTKITIDNVKWR